MLLFFFIAVPLFILCSRSSCFLVFDFFLNEFPVLYPIFSLLILDLLTSGLEIDDFHVRIEFRWYFPYNDNSERLYAPFHFFKAYTEFFSGCSGFNSSIGATCYGASFWHTIKSPVISILWRYAHVRNHLYLVHTEIMSHGMISVFVPDIHSKWHTIFTDCH